MAELKSRYIGDMEILMYKLSNNKIAVFPKNAYNSPHFYKVLETVDQAYKELNIIEK